MEKKYREKILSSKVPNKYAELIEKQHEIPMFFITNYKMQELMTILLLYYKHESIVEFEQEFGKIVQFLRDFGFGKIVEALTQECQFEYDQKDKIHILILTLMHGPLSSVQSIFLKNDPKYRSKVRTQYKHLSTKCYKNTLSTENRGANSWYICNEMRREPLHSLMEKSQIQMTYLKTKQGEISENLRRKNFTAAEAGENDFFKNGAFTLLFLSYLRGTFENNNINNKQWRDAVEKHCQELASLFFKLMIKMPDGTTSSTFNEIYELQEEDFIEFVLKKVEEGRKDRLL